MENVTIVRSMKRSTIGIRILPDAKVQVTIPFFYPKLFVNQLLKEKESWIRQKQQLVHARNRTQQNKSYWFLGKTYDLSIRNDQKEVVELTDKLYVASKNKSLQKSYLMSWYKQQARKFIVKRVALYATKAQLHYKSVQITSAETRWGSCSSQKSLNFNWKLIMAPIEVIDYVIVHELAHLKELNHSRAFWEEVRLMYPLYRQYRTWLNRNGHLLTI